MATKGRGISVGNALERRLREQETQIDLTMSQVAKDFVLGLPEVTVCARMHQQLHVNIPAYARYAKDYRSDYAGAVAQELGWD
jgi:hypothetical protein